MNRFMVVILALVVTLPVGLKSRQSAQKAASTAFFTPTSAHTIVQVSGDVRHPGIYPVSANSLTSDAILLAEPSWKPTISVSTGSGALVVSNGTDIHLAKNPDASAEISVGNIPAAQRLLLQIPLDMDLMNSTDFECLPGIGPVLAQRITEYRHNNGGKLTLKDLKLIKGIGDKKYKQLYQFFK